MQRRLTVKSSYLALGVVGLIVGCVVAWFAAYSELHMIDDAIAYYLLQFIELFL
jgi:hypothetical protein